MNKYDISSKKGLQELLVFPRGKFFIEKYGEWITFDDSFFNEIIEAYNSDVLRKPFLDKNHELKESFGELSNPSIREDGLYFECVLNNAGVELLSDGAYTSISPTFGELTDTTGKKWSNCLVSVSLTNVPALLNNYPDQQSQLEAGFTSGLKYFEFNELKETRQEKNMKNLEMILRKLELSPEASDMAIAEAIQKLIDQGVTQEDLIAAKDSMIESLNKKIEEMSAMVETASAELAKTKIEAETKEFESAFNRALEGGVIIPAEKEMYFDLFKVKKELCMKQFEKFSKKEVSTGIVMRELSADDRKVMAMAGLNPDKSEDVDFFKKINK